jgi:preprotein translocase subunit YajC
MKTLVVLGSLTLSAAQALAETPAGGAQAPINPISPFIPLLIIFGIFYFLILRPQQKKAKEQTKFIADLKKGDMVVTSGGIVGTIKSVTDRFITLEIDQGVNLKVLKSHILESAAALKENGTKKATTAVQPQE